MELATAIRSAVEELAGRRDISLEAVQTNALQRAHVSLRAAAVCGIRHDAHVEQASACESAVAVSGRMLFAQHRNPNLSAGRCAAFRNPTVDTTVIWDQ